jgi:hypothetical protein
MVCYNLQSLVRSAEGQIRRLIDEGKGARKEAAIFFTDSQVESGYRNSRLNRLISMVGPSGRSLSIRVESGCTEIANDEVLFIVPYCSYNN